MESEAYQANEETAAEERPQQAAKDSDFTVFFFDLLAEQRY